MKHLVLAGLTAAACAHAPADAALDVSAACAPGVWEIANEFAQPDGSMGKGAATSTRYCLAGGRVEMDEFRALDAVGGVVFRGVSFHVWNAERTHVDTLWVMVGDPGTTTIAGDLDADGVLVTTGQGSDAGGTFLERARQTELGGRSYRFEMDRNYENGATWIAPFNRLEATFASDETPDLPGALVGPFAEGAAAAGGEGVAILDGAARVTVQDAPLTITYATRYGGPDRWRVLTWTPSTGEIAVDDTPLG